MRMRKRSKHYSIISGLGTKRTEISLDSAVLATYAVQYEAEEEGTFTVKREQDVLSLELPISWALSKIPSASGNPHRLLRCGAAGSGDFSG